MRYQVITINSDMFIGSDIWAYKAEVVYDRGGYVATDVIRVEGPYSANEAILDAISDDAAEKAYNKECELDWRNYDSEVE